MKITILDESDNICTLDVDKETSILDLKALIEIEFKIPQDQQKLFFQQTPLDPKKKISDYPIEDSDIINVVKMFVNQNQGQDLFKTFQNIMQQQGGMGNQQQQGALNPQIIQEAQQLKKYYEDNPDQLNYILNQNREFAEAVLDNNIGTLCQYIFQKKQEQLKVRMEEQKRIAQLEQDYMNPDAQKEIEEIINKRNIEDNRNMAMEFNPEFFGSITMLYIEITVNNHPIQAFVDSGAQSTIMSRQCAERCGLLDKQFAGMAIGVGQAKILGRIHSFQLEILNKKIPSSFTVLDDDKIDFLLGLDMLKRYQCQMNLKDRCEQLTVPFLSDGQINRTVSMDYEKKMMEEDDQRKKEQNQSKPQDSQGQQKPSQQPQQQSQNIFGNNANNRQSTGGFQETDIKKLIDLGATRNEAIQTLTQCKGNVELAANIIAQQKFGF